MRVVIAGAGIVGSSIGYQLARRGIDTVILDKGLGPSEGSTGASSSICRCRYTHPEVVRLALDGRETYRNWADFTGLEAPRAGLVETGVLWMMGESREIVSETVSRLRSQGVGAENLSPSDVAERFPALSTCVSPLDWSGETEHECVDGEAFLFEPEGGYADPVGANQDLIEATRRLGGEVRFGAAVTSVVKQGGRVTGVTLADGSSVEGDLVINALGPWCNDLNRDAGVDRRWSLTPTRIQTVYLEWPQDLGRIPIGADANSGIYFRPESNWSQVLVGSVLAEDEEEEVDDPDDFKRSPDGEFVQNKLAAFGHRVPELQAKGTPSGTAGLYTINREDVHPVVGPCGVDGFWLANGFSGHGFKLAPAVGSMVARAVSGETMEYDTEVPMDFFAFDRSPIDVEVKNVLA